MYSYLDRHMRSLAEPDLFLLSAMRNFLAAAQRGRCVCQTLSAGFEARAVSEALPDFVNAMVLINRDGLERLRFAPIIWPKVSDDEARILSLFALGRDGDTLGAMRAAAGLVAEDAIAPLLVAIDTVGMALAGSAA